MKRKLVILFAAALLSVMAAVRAQQSTHPSNSAEAERYIKECESQWVASGASGDPSAVKRCLADDFLGVNIDGSEYDKAKEISNIQSNRNEFQSNGLGEVKVRFYGDAAVAQGSELWQKRSGERGRFVWTDTWIRRNDSWQVVAAEAVQAPPAPK